MHTVDFLSTLKVFAVKNRGHYASSEEDLLMLMKLPTTDTNLELADCFGYSRDGMVPLIYCLMIDLLDNKARGLLYGDAGCLSIGYIFSLILQKLLKIN